MCTAEKCLYVKDCLRQTQEPSESQSWSNFQYGCNQNNGFSEFLPNYAFVAD